MKIAVTSQNRREVTQHAGRCRKYWIYEIEDKQIMGKRILELPLEQSFHESAAHEPHPLDIASVLISGSMGQGMYLRLASKGIIGIVTDEKDPDTAVKAYLAGRLKPMSDAIGCRHGDAHHAYH